LYSVHTHRVGKKDEDFSKTPSESKINGKNAKKEKRQIVIIMLTAEQEEGFAGPF
jgi:hypothetical protein